MTKILAYAVNIKDVKAVEITATDYSDLHLCATRELLDNVDTLRDELNSPSLLARPQMYELERFAAEWGRQLLPASWRSNPPESCVLVPHAFLHGLPLHLIRTDSGNPLCVDSAVSVSGSLTALRRAMQRSDSSKRGWVDPFFSVRSKKMRKTILRLRHRPIVETDDAPYVPTGRRWLVAGVDALGDNDTIWRSLPIELLKAYAPREEVDLDANPYDSLHDVIAKRLVGQQYELVIIAAHGYHNPLDALDSGLVVRAAEEPIRQILQPILGRGMDEDGVPYVFQRFPASNLRSDLAASRPADLLSVADLEKMRAHLNCPLVVLLGCSAARPVLYAGDQPQSFAQIFLNLGAASVVAPVWDVRIPAVKAWATEFLRNLAGRSDQSRGAACNAASRSMCDAGAPLQDIGCMVLYGDYR